MRPAIARVKRPPVFLMMQTECVTCGREVHDPLTLETLGRFCSQRCLLARDLPSLLRTAA